MEEKLLVTIFVSYKFSLSLYCLPNQVSSVSPQISQFFVSFDSQKLFEIPIQLEYLLRLIRIRKLH